jgi:hypothetical protein
VALSLRSEIERELDGWKGFEVDTDNFTLKNERTYCGDPSNAVGRMFEGLVDVGVPRAAMRRLEVVRPALITFLKKTSLDDLDGEVLLEWLVKAAGIVFVDDFYPLPSAAKSELGEVLARLVKDAVLEDVSVPAFAESVVRGLRTWAKHQAVDPGPLRAYQEHLTRGGFHGVVWYREPDAQTELVAHLLDDAVRLFRLRWVRAPTPVRPYSPEERFVVGDRLHHPKFGAGEVVRRLDGKIEVRFKGTVRTLAAKTDG